MQVPQYKPLKDIAVKRFFDEDIPECIHIWPSGHQQPNEEQLFHVLIEDPFDSTYKEMTAKQIEEQYKIQL